MNLLAVPMFNTILKAQLYSLQKLNRILFMSYNNVRNRAMDQGEQGQARELPAMCSGWLLPNRPWQVGQSANLLNFINPAYYPFGRRGRHKAMVFFFRYRFSLKLNITYWVSVQRSK